VHARRERGRHECRRQGEDESEENESAKHESSFREGFGVCGEQQVF
jgi:hypothetical protein